MAKWTTSNLKLTGTTSAISLAIPVFPGYSD
jgi:hypothetical protein